MDSEKRKAILSPDERTLARHKPGFFLQSGMRPPDAGPMQTSGRINAEAQRLPVTPVMVTKNLEKSTLRSRPRRSEIVNTRTLFLRTRGVEIGI